MQNLLLEQSFLYHPSNFIACFPFFFFSLWLCSPLDLGRFFSFLILYTVGRTPWTADQPVARPLPTHRTTKTQNELTQISISRVGFEPKTPVFERPKTVRALDRADTAIGFFSFTIFLIRVLGCGVQLGPLGTLAINRPIVPTPGDYEDGEFGGMMIGRGNRTTGRKPAPVLLCPSQIPHDLTGRELWPPRLGSQPLTA
jgi:hypothetical protein